ncbi:MAG: NFACT RNA binding domain-containing protein [Lactobacillus sp.]|nr:NFACT RNA binding domain-containing protein [Lactobacillus sp.]
MAFDGLFIHSLLGELSSQIVSGRLSKIAQPFEYDLVLTFRKDRQNYPLLISANAQYPRMYLTKQSIQNPDKAPTFVMVLRKYLEGSVLQKIEQVGVERIVNFHFSNRNELGDEVSLILSVELMGRHSNVILYDANDGKIIDLLKRINPDENRARLLLPRAKYELPPLLEKINPFEITADNFNEIADSPADFAQKIAGVDRDDRNELAGYLEDDFSYESFKTFLDHFDRPKAYTFLSPNHKRSIFPYLPYHLDLQKEDVYQSLSYGLDEFYDYRAKRDWVKQKASVINRVIKNEQSKLSKKLKKLAKQLDQAENSEDYRIKGELLNVNLHLVKPGADEAEVPNYYEENKLVKIKIDPALSPAKNAQKYFNKYKKLRDSIIHVKEQTKLAEDNLRYFDSVKTAVDNADPQDIDQIQEELISQGYLKKPATKQRKKRIKENDLPSFKLSSGRIVMVGKNNLQNDWLTLRKANKTDMWFHVKNMPGSHVIFPYSDPSDEELIEASEIAAYFSKARLSENVPVDHVQVKRIKKPNGAKPGYVIYTGQKTLVVTPQEDEIKAKRQS